MAKGKEKPKNRIKNTIIGSMDKLIQSMISTVDDNYVGDQEIKLKNDVFQKAINRELDLAKGVSDGQFVDFLLPMITQVPSAKQGIGTVTNQANFFQSNINSLFSYYQGANKSKFIEIEDLKFLKKFIPSLGQAVNVMIDHIAASDDISNSISRTLHIDDFVNADVASEIIEEIEEIEKETGYLKDLRSFILSNTLVPGRYYAYTIGYNELFQKFEKLKSQNVVTASKNVNPFGAPYNKNDNNIRKDSLAAVRESVLDDIGTVTLEAASSIEDPQLYSLDLEPVLESTISDFTSECGMTKAQNKEFMSELKPHLPDVSLLQSTIPSDIISELPAIESVINSSYGTMFKEAIFKPVYEKRSTKSKNQLIADLSVKPEGATNGKPYTSGTYIKYIEARKLIKIELLNTTIGYYYIHSEKKAKELATLSANGNYFSVTTGGMLSLHDLSESQQTRLIKSLTSAITNHIVRNFNHDFVSKNEDFKELIANAIMEDGFIDKKYKIQFIPAEDIIEYAVNKDADGVGTSVLADSIMTGKLLASLIAYKMITYMNQTGNTQVMHIHKNGIRTDMANEIQSVVRDLQEDQIQFSDFLSNQMMFSKFSRQKHIGMPTAKNGNKLVEIETMEGQDIPLNTDMEDFLNKMTNISTKVPFTILGLESDPQLAKAVTSDNIKFAGLIAGLQSDLEPAITKQYIKMIENSGMSKDKIDICKNHFQFKFNRPKVLSNANASDFISNIQSLMESISDIILGKYGPESQEPKTQYLKDELIKEGCRYLTQFFDWDVMNDFVKKAEINYKPPENPNGGSADNSGGMGF